MSWIRSAVTKAVEVGGRNNITRTVRSYADTVVHQAGQAVAGGARIIQDRMGARHYRSFKETTKRLEEIAIFSKGSERTYLLRRWLVDLKEVERASGGSSNDKNLEEQQDSEEPRNSPMVFYFDSDGGVEPMNFRDIFLHSHALEGIILSMIIEPPTEEEVSLLLELFGLCITGGKEVHNAILSSIQDLAKAFSRYQDEVLVKRDELLQFAQGAVTGLKLNADVARIDTEVSGLRQKIDKLGVLQSETSVSHKDVSGNTTGTIEALKEALAEIQLCSKLESLLLKKKSINTGDSLEIHCQKVDKLKILSESLASSSSKAEKRISDHRHQQEEALNFRLAKDKEVGDFEKELCAEIAGLEKQRDELEAELKKVNVSLSAAISRLSKTREERDQFDEASNRMVVQLKAKEDDLSRSIASCKVESDVVCTWINFLEDTWLLQSTHSEQKEKNMIDDLEKYGKYFVKLTNHHLLQCKEALAPAIDRTRTIVDNLKNLGGRSEIESELSIEPNPHKYIEEEFLKTETKIIATFSVVDKMKQLFYAERENAFRGDYSKASELFEEIERMREDFESIERPILSIESPPKRETTSTQETIPRSPTHSQKTDLSKSDVDEPPKDVSTVSTADTKSASNTDQQLDPEAELAMLESEFGKVSGQYSTDEVGGWEFDELEQELNSGSTVGHNK